MNAIELISCPICHNKVKPQGLSGHIRLTHPNEDYKTITRKMLVPTVKGKKILQVVDIGNGDFQINWCSSCVGEKAHMEHLVMTLNLLMEPKGYKIIKH
jgi:hypothetical protein